MAVERGSDTTTGRVLREAAVDNSTFPDHAPRRCVHTSAAPGVCPVLPAVMGHQHTCSHEDVARDTRRRLRASDRQRLSRRACGATTLFMLLCHLQCALANSFGGACDTSGRPSVVTGTSSCGVKVTLWFPTKSANISRPFSASSGTVRLGLAVSKIVPNSAMVTMLLPPEREGFVFNYGGTSTIVPVVTKGGTEAILPMHGTGMPRFTVQTQMNGTVSVGQLVTVIFGGMGTPTLADAEAGYEFDLTYVRNPYASAGLPTSNVLVNLLQANGSVWHAGKAPLPEIVPNNLTAATAMFELVDPAAGIQTDIIVTMTTLGWIPSDGRIEIFLPPGFIITYGSTVAIEQTNIGEQNAVYVKSVNELERKVTLVLAGALGFPVSSIKPLDRASFRLTTIRNPYSGLTGTFRLLTFSGSSDAIDQGNSLRSFSNFLKCARRLGAERRMPESIVLRHGPYCPLCSMEFY